MEFFNSAVDVLKTLVVALGAGLGVWGAVNLMATSNALARELRAIRRLAADDEST